MSSKFQTQIWKIVIQNTLISHKNINNNLSVYLTCITVGNYYEFKNQKEK